MFDPVAHLIVSGSGQEDAARIRQAFQSRRHVDAFAEDVVVLDHDVTDIDADAQLDALSGFCFAGHFRNATLDFDRAFDGLDRAGKFQQETIAHRFHEPPSAGRDGRVDDGSSQGADRGQRPGLVLAHEAAVADDVGRDYRGKLTLQYRPPRSRVRRISAGKYIGYRNGESAIVTPPAGRPYPTPWRRAAPTSAASDVTAPQ